MANHDDDLLENPDMDSDGMDDSPSELLSRYGSVDDAACELEVGAATVRRYLNDGLLSGEKIAGRWLVDLDDLADLAGELDQEREPVLPYLSSFFRDCRELPAGILAEGESPRREGPPPCA